MLYQLFDITKVWGICECIQK